LVEVGNDVVEMDADLFKLEKFKTGMLAIWKTSLEALFEQNVPEGRLHLTTYPLLHGQVQFIAVGTASDEDRSADLQYHPVTMEKVKRISGKHAGLTLCGENMPRCRV